MSSNQAPRQVTPAAPTPSAPASEKETHQRWFEKDVLKLIGWVEENYLLTEGSPAQWSRKFVETNLVPNKRADSVVRKWTDLKKRFFDARARMDSSGWGVETVRTQETIKSIVEKICPHFFRLEPLMGSNRSVSSLRGAYQPTPGGTAEWDTVVEGLGERSQQENLDQDSQDLGSEGEGALLTGSVGSRVGSPSAVRPWNEPGPSIAATVANSNKRKERAGGDGDANDEIQEISSQTAVQPSKKKGKTRHSNNLSEVLAGMQAASWETNRQIREDGFTKFSAELAETKSHNATQDALKREELDWKMKQAGEELTFKRESAIEELAFRRQVEEKKLEIERNKVSAAGESRKEELRLRELEQKSQEFHRSEELRLRKMEIENERLRLTLELEKLRARRGEDKDKD